MLWAGTQVGTHTCGEAVSFVATQLCRVSVPNFRQLWKSLSSYK